MLRRDSFSSMSLAFCGPAPPDRLGRSILPLIVRSDSCSLLHQTLACSMPEPWNHYSGFHPPSPKWSVPRIRFDQISPQDFYAKFVATRTPCVLEGCTYPQANWTPQSVADMGAGAISVQVEGMGADGFFGSGKLRSLTNFDQFVRRLETQGEIGLYMTTQYYEPSPDSDPDRDVSPEVQLDRVLDYCQPPLTALLGRFEMTPAILGHLVPQQVNLWIGATSNSNSKGSSSGLHHDYADNLYVLCKGKKRFTLFSPKDAEHLLLVGKSPFVHPNGLISYDGAAIRADGANLVDVAKYHLRTAEEGLAQAEAASIDTSPFEDAVDEAMDELLRLETAPQDNQPGRSSKKRGSKRPRSVLESELSSAEPPSFSRIDTKSLRARDYGRYPSLKKATAIVCELKQSDALYLPAGWFHEVTSFGQGTASEGSSTHMAFNYWMHPPTEAGTFEQPYDDGYWKDRWLETAAIIEARRQEIMRLSSKKPKPRPVLLQSHGMVWRVATKEP
ncbi:cupin-like domain-containing protein [Polychytrium aggregatum]|uniref:cupin-like domain-containing protein n=1 Tax=Polychytrium aggregatum TaxID=110093 RepID=UPI0022FED7E8|nr:cupin-like domain-containing protein [Polychytrium aggregatum]KAI9209803.1 cupin-like domain-containing protein [Polychytrium aggregatum]